jgi:uncharacterized protein YjgD (DUF1641 family)
MSIQMENPPATNIPLGDLSRDLEQLAELATLVSSARDAMSDEIVTRLSRVFSDGISLLDRLTRNEGLMRLLEVLDRPESQHLLIGLSTALSKMSREIAAMPPARGGMIGLLRLAREPGTQEGLRSLSLLGQHWSESMRDLHRRGGR